MNNEVITKVVKEAKKLLQENPGMKYKQAVDKAKEMLQLGHA